MKIKKNLAIKLVKELIQDENFKKDIIDLISATSDSSGIAKSEEKKIFNNLLKVHKKTVDDVMVPRGEIIFIDQNINKENIIKIINKEAHSRMPVVKNDLEHCLGMVHIKDLFKKINNKSFNIKSLLREVIYIPSATPVFNLLQKMKKQNIHLAIVMDEFNSVTGLVTIEDLVEEIVGEIEDEHDKDEAPMYRQKNENIIMDAAMLVDDFEREFDVNIPEDLKEDVGTIGGIIFNMAGRIPRKKKNLQLIKNYLSPFTRYQQEKFLKLWSVVLNLNNLLSSISRPSYLIIICSVLYIFSLPPFGISFFYYLSFVIFFLNILKSDVFFKKKIFYFFLVTQLVTLSWIIQSFYSGGTGYLFLGIILVSILSLFVAFLHYSATILILTFYKQKLLLIFLLPLGLSIVELLKEFIFGGFPWNPSAIIYYKNIWILKSLPYLGVYGLGLVVHLIVGLMIYFLYYKNKIIPSVLLALSIIFYFFGFIENNNIKKTEDETLDILLIQPNLYESLVEFDVLKNLEKYEQLTIEALSKSPKTDLIIWPEGSLPIDLNNRIGLLSRVSSLINEDQKIIVGSSAIEEDQLFNRLYVIDHQGKIIDFYDKQKLVLFGEYIPFIKPLVSKFLNLGMNYTPGHVQKTLNLPKDINAVPMICFESIFNYQSINKEICGSDMVIQISNDSWFGKWYGPHQHLANSLLRSVEFQKPLIRSTPSGITSIVDRSGKIIQTIASNKKGYLYYQHPITKNQSICSSTLNSVMVLLFLIFLFSFLYVRIKK